MRTKTNDTSRTSRRDFLKLSGAAATTSILAGNIDIARGAHAAGSDTIKIGLVGCGGRGTGAVMQALSTNAPTKLWALGDVFADKVERSYSGLLKGVNTAGWYNQNAKKDGDKDFTDKIDVPPERRFVGFDAYKKVIDCGVDVVFLISRPHFYPIHFEYAIEKDKHVFVEKPLATDAPGVRRLMAANEKAKAKGLKVSAGLQRHHDIRYQEAIKRIRDGAIGELIYLRCYFNSQGARPPFIRTPDMTEMEYQLRNLYYFTWLSGDHIVEQHIHNIDACNWIKGDYPVSAQGQGGRQVRTGKEFGEIYDHHFVEFIYKDEMRMFSQCRHIQNTWFSEAEHAHGTKGVANISSGGRKISIEGPEKWRFRGTTPNPYQVEHDVLFDAICNDKPHNEVDHAAKSTLTAIMGRMATYSGKLVTWDQALNSDVDLSPNRYAWDGTPVALPDENGYYPAAMPGTTKAF